LSQGSLEEGLRASARVIEEERANVKADVAEGVPDTYVLTTFIDNTSIDKCWILDSGSVVHVYSQKELFNFLVAKEEGNVKMVDGSACEVIGTGTINVTGIYEMVSGMSRRHGTI